MKLLRDKIKRDTYMVSKLCGMLNRGDLRDNHPQQRKSGQWDNSTRDNFIVTVIKNEDFDPIKICEQLTEQGVVLWLIDGLQRSTTIANYKSGKFALGKKIDPFAIEYQEAIKGEDGNITYKNVSYDLRGKAYKDLPDKIKEDFDNCPVDIVKHLDCTDEEVGRHIVRYNSGRPMVVAQRISAYMHNTAKYVKELSEHAFFNDCANYSPTADRNGTVDKVVSEAIMGLNFFDAWNKDAKKIGKHLNNNATEDMFHKFGQYLDRLLEVITPQTGKLFSSKNALIWFMLFDRFSKTGLSDDKFQLFLEHYEEIKKIKIKVSHRYILVKGSGKYTNNLSFAELDGCKSTKDKGVIEDKLYILQTIMNDFLHCNKGNSNKENGNKKSSNKKNEKITDNQNITVGDIIREYIDNDIDDDEIELYEMMANDFSEAIENIDSEFLSEDNRPSFVALVGYADRIGKSQLLNDWLPKFEKKKALIANQKENFLHMKQDFEQYLKKCA